MNVEMIAPREQGSNSRRLSPMQEGMLAETLLAPTSGVNIVQFVIHYKERVDEDALRRAWELAIDSFPIFRTKFAWQEGSPSQCVESMAEIPWEETAMASSEDFSELQFKTFLDADRRRGVRLDAPPLMRLTLVRAPDHDRLIWTFHHILLDGSSVPIVLQGVEDAYRTIKLGGRAGRMEGADYGNFLNWLDERDKLADQEFWRDYLVGIQTATPLFEAKQRPVGTSIDASETLERLLTRETTEALRNVASRFDVTLGTIVQGAWGLLLCRQHDIDDAVFGVTRSGRHFSSGAESIVGLLINTVPVRVKVDPAATLEEFLRNLRADTLAIRRHEATPLTEIQAASAVRRGEPLFNSLVIFEGASVEQRLAALDEVWKCRNIEIIEQSTFALVLTVQSEDRLSLELTYDPAILDYDVVKRTLSQLATLLESMAWLPDVSVDALRWLPPEERERIESFNAPLLLDGGNHSIVSLFEECVGRMPNAEAVHAPDGRLTYGELDRRANQLAHFLAERGVKRGDTVAIVLERTSQLIVAIWGILKTGAAYLPIDTFYPKERIQAIADATQFNLTITLSRLKNSLPTTKSELVFLDELESELQKRPRESLGRHISPKDAAYVIFTSGTTGTPKGVSSTHANLASIHRAWFDAYHLDQMSAHLQLASPSFDVFAGELIRAHCSGLKLVMCPYEYALKPNKLFELIQKERVDIAEMVPLMLRSLVEYLERTNQKLDTMRLLSVGADVWYVHDYQRFQKVLPEGARLVNSYGISETTIDSTYFEGDVSHLPGSAAMPLGRPFGNTALYVLDERRRTVPIGVVGEIYIGGNGVTPGYVNDPVRTRDRFMPDPFRSEEDAVMYASGDLGRFRSDGSLELLGRADHQVKVRGFRIELGEVESVLAGHPDIAQAVVVAQQRGPGEKRLIAYFVAREGHAIDSRKLRGYLGDKLPYYMIPAALIRLDEIPRSANGKVDRNGLPVPEDIDRVERHYEPPRGELEARLRDLWEEVLGVSPIGVHDDFFEIGGHSLLAVTLFAKIEARFGQELPITALFEGRSIARMAEGLRHARWDWSNIVELGGSGERPPLFWVHTLGGGGGLFRYEKLVQRMDLGRKSYGIRAPAEPFNRVERMAEYYAEEMRRIQPTGPYHLLGYCFGGIVAYEIAECLHRRGEKVALLGLIEAPAPVPPASPVASLGSAAAFLQNALRWVVAFTSWPKKKRSAWMQRVARSIKDGTAFEPSYDLEDFLDNAERQGDYRKFVEAHWDALEHYSPKPHPVRGTVFRVRTQSLRNFEHTLGWHHLCERGVDVEVVPGAHGTILDPDGESQLAKVLERRLGRSSRG